MPASDPGRCTKSVGDSLDGGARCTKPAGHPGLHVYMMAEMRNNDLHPDGIVNLAHWVKTGRLP